MLILGELTMANERGQQMATSLLERDRGFDGGVANNQKH